MKAPSVRDLQKAAETCAAVSQMERDEGDLDTARVFDDAREVLAAKAVVRTFAPPAPAEETMSETAARGARRREAVRAKWRATAAESHAIQAEAATLAQRLRVPARAAYSGYQSTRVLMIGFADVEVLLRELGR